MPALLLGVVGLVLLLFAAKGFSKADPKQAARVLRYVGGGAALLPRRIDIVWWVLALRRIHQQYG
jgi:hypothetical protein